MNYIRQEDLHNWLADIGEEYRLTAPVEKDGVILYEPIQSLDEIVWDFEKPVNSIKEIFFPQTEILMELQISGNGSDEIKEVIPTEKNILLNVRPCDAHGLNCLDAMFLDDSPPDVYYAARRQNSVVMGLSCSHMGESCFCTSVGGSPGDTVGMDVMLSKYEEGFLVELLTPIGEALFSDLPVTEQVIEVESPFEKGLFPVPNEEILKKSFDSELWGMQAERCISCRICAYVCPTCRCFDIRDEVVGGSNGTKQANRIRCWDSCASEAYRRIAGGHNPRASKIERLRNRVLCKLYYYPQQYGMLSCVGCGRCIDACPVGMDITEIMSVLVEGPA